MLRRERLCDDDEEITRGGEERVDMEIWWCWLLRAAVPLNVHISLSLSSHTLFVQIIIASYLSLSPFIVYSLSPPPPLSRVLSLSLSSVCVCVCLSIYLDGWRARAHWHVFLCTHTHSVRIHNVLACLAPCCCCLFQPHARALSIKSSTHNTPMHSSSSTTTTTQQYIHIIIPASSRATVPAEFKHINKRRKRNQQGFP